MDVDEGCSLESVIENGKRLSATSTGHRSLAKLVLSCKVWNVRVMHSCIRLTSHAQIGRCSAVVQGQLPAE